MYDGKIVSEKEAIKKAIDSGKKWTSADTHKQLREYDKKLHKQMSPELAKGTFNKGGTTMKNDPPVGSTPSEVADDIPAMISEGEFVIPADVVRYVGLDKIRAMMQEAKHGLACMEDEGLIVDVDEDGRPQKDQKEKSDDKVAIIETVQIEKVDPEILIVDSIQTLHTSHIESSPGSVSQIRECTSELIKYAKQTGTAIFLIGHINKDGAIAGPKILEHMVDTVLQFEGDRHHVYRILRTIKNRFGSASELGVYEMGQNGLREVNNPSEILISDRNEETSGVAIATDGCGARIINLNSNVEAKLVADNPFYAFATIPAGTYKTSDSDVTTFGVKATFVSSSTVPEEVVYEVVRAVFENLDDFRKLHPAFAHLSPDQMISDGLSAPLHKGAIKYYKEKGWM